MVTISGGEVSVGSNNFRFEQAYGPDSTNEQVALCGFFATEETCEGIGESNIMTGKQCGSVSSGIWGDSMLISFSSCRFESLPHCGSLERVFTYFQLNISFSN